MKINRTLKRALAIGLGAYITAYAGLAGYAAIDSKRNFWKTFDNAQDLSNFKEFSCEIDGKKKTLGILGEYHNYSEKEMHNAANLIEKYDTIALEGSADKTKSKLFCGINQILNYPSVWFYLNGSGRRSLGVDFKNAVSLEDKNPIDELNLIQKAIATGDSIEGLLTAPLAYFKGQNELKMSKEQADKEAKKYQKGLTWYYSNGEKRNEIMADKIIDILEDEKTNNLFCAVGKSHVDGIISNLEKRIKLEEKTAEK